MLVCMKKKEAPSAGSRTPRPILRNLCVSQALLELNATPDSYQLPLGYGGGIYPELCGALNLFTLNNRSRLAPEDMRATWPSASRGDVDASLRPFDYTRIIQNRCELLISVKSTKALNRKYHDSHCRYVTPGRRYCSKMTTLASPKTGTSLSKSLCPTASKARRAVARAPTTSAALDKPSAVHHLVLGMPSGFAASAEDPKQ